MNDFIGTAPNLCAKRGWVSKKEAQQYLGVSRKWMEKYMSRGDIPFSRIDRRVFIKIKDIDKFLISNQVII